jgi:hypothetical protein
MIIRFIYYNRQLLLFDKEMLFFSKSQQVQSELTCSGMMPIPNFVKIRQLVEK